jgi:hypothetical protein
VSELALQSLSFIDPSKEYCIFLHERWKRFQIWKIATEHVVDIHTSEKFFDAFSSASPHDQDFLGELYQFNFLMKENSRGNPDPYVGNM